MMVRHQSNMKMAFQKTKVQHINIRYLEPMRCRQKQGYNGQCIYQNQQVHPPKIGMFNGDM